MYLYLEVSHMNNREAKLKWILCHVCALVTELDLLHHIQASTRLDTTQCPSQTCSRSSISPLCATNLLIILEMSSLPKQHNFIQPSSSSRQTPFRAANTSSATPSTATSRPRPIGPSSEHNKRSDASYTQLGDNLQQHDDHEPTPERPFEETEEGYDDHDHDTRPKPAPTNFKPFFTLIEDANSSDYHHPTVHYIFSDDDAELVTEASLRVLETGHHATSPRNDSEEGLVSADQQSSHHRHSDRPSLLPPPIPGVKERFIVLDFEQSATAIGNPSSAPDALLAGTSAGTGTTVVSSSPAQRQQQQQQPYGYRIVSAHSLTPDWQVLDASLSPAPTFDTPQQNTGDQASVSNTLMLRIEGTGGYSRDIPVGKDKEGQQTLEEMMEQFDKRMAELRRVIETSGDYSPLGATAQPGGDVPRAGEEGEGGHGEGGEEAVPNE